VAQKLDLRSRIVGRDCRQLSENLKQGCTRKSWMVDAARLRELYLHVKAKCGMEGACVRKKNRKALAARSSCGFRI
jgi:hypothetical protein